MHSVPVIMCFKTHVSILYFRHPFDYQIIYLINTSSASTSTSVDKLIHLIMEFILFMTPASCVTDPTEKAEALDVQYTLQFTR